MEKHRDSDDNELLTAQVTQGTDDPLPVLHAPTQQRDSGAGAVPAPDAGASRFVVVQADARTGDAELVEAVFVPASPRFVVLPAPDVDGGGDAVSGSTSHAVAEPASPGFAVDVDAPPPDDYARSDAVERAVSALSHATTEPASPRFVVRPASPGRDVNADATLDGVQRSTSTLSYASTEPASPRFVVRPASPGGDLDADATLGGVQRSTSTLSYASTEPASPRFVVRPASPADASSVQAFDQELAPPPPQRVPTTDANSSAAESATSVGVLDHRSEISRADAAPALEEAEGEDELKETGDGSVVNSQAEALAGNTTSSGESSQEALLPSSTAEAPTTLSHGELIFTLPLPPSPTSQPPQSGQPPPLLSQTPTSTAAAAGVAAAAAPTTTAAATSTAAAPATAAAVTASPVAVAASPTDLEQTDDSVHRTLSTASRFTIVDLEGEHGRVESDNDGSRVERDQREPSVGAAIAGSDDIRTRSDPSVQQVAADDTASVGARIEVEGVTEHSGADAAASRTASMPPTRSMSAATEAVPVDEDYYDSERDDEMEELTITDPGFFDPPAGTSA
jgi:S-DNA-T family DNA segregation ATPase FtsK/SpoIIIE